MTESSENTVDFALLGHPDSYDHLGDLLLHSRPDYTREKLAKYQATLTKFFEWTPSYAAKTLMQMETPDGRQVRGRLIICTFLPESIQSPRQMMVAYKKTMDGCRLAQELGAGVVSLGGFTSIVAETASRPLPEELNIALTTGNTLTAALAVAQLEQLMSDLNWDLGSQTLAVLGASGDIGQACAGALVPRVKRSLLIARNKARLQEARERLPKAADVIVSTDVQAALEADIILAATSAPEALLSENDLRPGTVVVDLGYPKTLSYSPRPRTDLLVISGGLAEMPSGLDIRYYTRLPRERIMFGCFSEAIVLALAGRHEAFSAGRGQITAEKMAIILDLAKAYGFQPAAPYRGNHPITGNELNQFLSAAKR